MNFESPVHRNDQDLGSIDSFRSPGPRPSGPVAKTNTTHNITKTKV